MSSAPVRMRTTPVRMRSKLSNGIVPDHFLIYIRWGNLVFESKDINEG
jgi:hypothetical protein